MQILITAATNFEMKPLLDAFGVSEQNLTEPGRYGFNYKNLSLVFRVTGIGIAPTMYNLSKELSKFNYNLALNTGIAGSFRDEFKVGDVVAVTSEQFAEFGIEDRNEYFSLFDRRLVGEDEMPFSNGMLVNETLIASDHYDSLPAANGLTAGIAHGNENSIAFLKKRYDAGVETMEGAAFFYCCLMEKMNFIQVRSISNMVEPRDKSKWNPALALKNMTVSIYSIINELVSI